MDKELNLQRAEGPRCKLSKLNWKLNYFSMDKSVDRVHRVVDQRRHGPWWTMDRGATGVHRSMSSPALRGSAPCRDGTGSKRVVWGTFRRAPLGRRGGEEG
jgi:hypothetical protein